MRRWDGFATKLDHSGGPVSYCHFYSTPWPESMNDLVGGTPTACCLVEDPDGDHYAWIESGEDFPCMLQGHEGVFSMQFAYGYKVEVERGRGEVVRGYVTEV